jgi:signal peptidase II
VADFFHFYAGNFSFYVFNIADAAITLGVVVLLADAFLRPDEKSGNKSS